jgi:hypothetical protein
VSTALYDTLDALEDGIQAMGRLSPDYWDKMMWKVPTVPSVERVPWLVERVRGKTILHLGCVGTLHEALLKTCARAYGIDQEPARYPDYHRLDVEAMGMPLPVFAGVEVVLLGEVLEHMVNPGALLHKVREGYPGCEVIVTVPNAFSEAGYTWMKRGTENVNKDHTAWYSWRTLTTLVEKCGYAVQEFYWHTGKPLFAEGLVMVVRLQE